MNRKDHWEQVYTTKPIEKLGWYEPHLLTSLQWIDDLRLPPDAPLIDVGGGTSTLADDLLDAGHRSITVLDISGKALTLLKSRLGEMAGLVTWQECDITTCTLPLHYFSLWHDRAVLHFLTQPEQQRQYREQLLKALRVNGHLILGTFALEAPPQCSGLPVQRYSAGQLQEVLGPEFALKRQHKELHVTPGGIEQMYLYSCFQRKN